MSARWKGSTAVQLQRVESKWTSQRGWEAVYIYVGPKALISAAATNSAYVQYATSVDVVPDRNLSELRVTFANIDNSQPDQYTEESSLWTFEPMSIEKNTEQNPKYTPLGNISARAGLVKRILLAIKEYENEVATGISLQNSDKDKNFDLNNYITYKNADDSEISASNESLAEEMAGLIVNGHDTYPSGKYILKNVKVVPPNTAMSVNHFKTLFQWGTDRVVNLIASSPPSITNAGIIGNLIDVFPNERWLKLPPTIYSTNNGKFEIITEFQQQGQYELPYQLNPWY